MKAIPIIHYFILLLAVIGLGACSKGNKSVDYFLMHPEKLQSVYDQCVYLDQNISEHQSQECITVLKAIPIFQSYLSEFASTPNQFSMNIMQAEIKLVQLQQDYHAALREGQDRKRIKQLKNAIHQLEVEIQSRFAIIRISNK